MRISDWSSDVCSSDLVVVCPKFAVVEIGRSRQLVDEGQVLFEHRPYPADNGIITEIEFLARLLQMLLEHIERRRGLDRKSGVSGKSVSVRVDLGGLRIINTKTNKQLSNSTREL